MGIKETTKRTKLLIISLLSCTFLLAQQSQISNFVRIDFPGRAIKLSIEELKTIIGKRRNILPMLYLPVDTSHQYYSIDSILLSLHGELWQAPKNYLKTQQKSFEAISKVDGMVCDCTTQIKEINNYSVLVTNVDSRDWGNYFFYSVNRNNSAVLNGSLFYFKSNSDKAKALIILEELLDNVAYKL
jgi:hypothetical protein